MDTSMQSFRKIARAILDGARTPYPFNARTNTGKLASMR